MNQGKLVFAQLMEHLPLSTFRRCVVRYHGERKVQSFSCLDQFLCMAFAQLTYRESLRDIEACLRAQRSKLYHLGIRSAVARNTLANANAVRNWRIYADFAARLMVLARRLYANEPFGVDLKETVYALDTTTIDLCLSVFPWAPFRSTRAAVKLHTITQLQRCRWQVELFFKWIKQHLRIKAFFGTSENAVKSQIWIAVSVYVLVAIVKKRFELEATLYEILQLSSLTMFERTPLDQLLARVVTDAIQRDDPNQLILFE